MDDGGPAFPLNRGNEVSWGMSLRDWLAGQALAGIMATQSVGSESWVSVGKAAKLVDKNFNDIIAGFAYQLADAMIAYRAKGK